MHVLTWYIYLLQLQWALGTTQTIEIWSEGMELGLSSTESPNSSSPMADMDQDLSVTGPTGPIVVNLIPELEQTNGKLPGEAAETAVNQDGSNLTSSVINLTLPVGKVNIIVKNRPDQDASKLIEYLMQVFRNQPNIPNSSLVTSTPIKDIPKGREVVHDLKPIDMASKGILGGRSLDLEESSGPINRTLQDCDGIQCGKHVDSSKVRSQIPQVRKIVRNDKFKDEKRGVEKTSGSNSGTNTNRTTQQVLSQYQNNNNYGEEEDVDTKEYYDEIYDEEMLTKDTTVDICWTNYRRTLDVAISWDVTPVGDMDPNEYESPALKDYERLAQPPIISNSFKLLSWTTPWYQFLTLVVAFATSCGYR